MSVKDGSWQDECTDHDAPRLPVSADATALGQHISNYKAQVLRPRVPGTLDPWMTRSCTEPKPPNALLPLLMGVQVPLAGAQPACRVQRSA